MKNIIFYARLVKIISCALMPIVTINLLIKWLFPEIISSHSFFAGFLYSYQPTESTIASMPLVHRFIAMAIETVSLQLFLSILLLVIVIMNRVQQHEIFSVRIARLFHSMSKYAFFFVLYTPISKTLLSVVETLHKSPHTLAISFDVYDLCNIFIFGFLMVMTLLMEQGAALQTEQSLTV